MLLFGRDLRPGSCGVLRCSRLLTTCAKLSALALFAWLADAELMRSVAPQSEWWCGGGGPGRARTQCGATVRVVCGVCAWLCTHTVWGHSQSGGGVPGCACTQCDAPVGVVWGVPGCACTQCGAPVRVVGGCLAVHARFVGPQSEWLGGCLAVHAHSVGPGISRRHTPRSVVHATCTRAGGNDALVARGGSQAR